MEWTPQHEARYQEAIKRRSARSAPQPTEAPQDDRGYITGHLAPAVLNAPAKLSHAFGEGFYGLADIVTGATDAERELSKQERARRWGEVTMTPAPSTGMLDTVTDVAGEIAPRIGAALLPAGIVGKAAQAVRAPAMLANLAGDVAAGTLSGLGESPQEAQLQAAEFGAGGLATEVGRRLFGRKGAAIIGSLGNAGVAAGGQALRGNDLGSKEALTNIALQAAFPVAIEGVGAVGRRFGRQKTEAPITPRPEQPFSNLQRDINAEISTINDPDFVGNVFLTRDGLPIQRGDHGLRLNRDTVRRSDEWTPEPIPENTGLQTEGYVHPDTPIPDRRTIPMTPAELLQDSGLRLGDRRNLQEEWIPQPIEDTGLRVEGYRPPPEPPIPARRFLQRADENTQASQQLRNAAEENMLAPETITATSQEAGGEILNETSKQTRRLKKLQPSQSGAVSMETLGNLGAAGVGAIAGGVMNDENPTAGAIAGGLAALGLKQGVQHGRKIFGQAGKEAAVKQEQAIPSPLGAVTRSLEKTGKLNTTADMDAIKSQARGLQSTLEKRATAAKKTLDKEFMKLDPTMQAHGVRFVESDGGAAAQTDLDLSPLPDTVKTALKDLKAVKIRGQESIHGSLADKKRRAQIEETLGLHTSNSYAVDTDPNHQFDDALVRQLADEQLQGQHYDDIRGKAGDREIAYHDTREYLNARRSKDAAGTGSSNRIGRGMFIAKKELTPTEWKGIADLRGNVKLDPHEDMVIRGIVDSGQIRPQDKEALRLIVESNKKLTADEAEPLLNIVRKSIISDVHRKVLGEIKDPLAREYLTIAKLTNSVKSAETISGIMKSKNVAGELGFEPRKWQEAMSAASTSGDKERLKFLDSMRTLPDNPELGALRGAKVQPEVYDAMTHKVEDWLGGGMAATGFKKVGQALRTVYTRLNPAAWTHNYGQIVTQAMASGVSPLELLRHGKALKANGKEVKEAMEAGILDDHIGTTFSDQAKTFDPSMKPRRFGKTKDAWEWTWDKLSSGYGYGDKLIRFSAFMNNKADGIKLGQKQKLTGDALNDFAKNYAIKETDRYTYNYTNQAPLVKQLRDVPLINTFLPYTAETVRIMKNLAQDLLQGDGVKKIRAAKRLSAMLAVPVAAAATIEAGMDGDETEEFKKMKRMMPPWMRGRMQVGLGRNKQGQMESFNMTPWTQAGDLIATARSLVTGDFEAALENNPIFGLQKTPLLNILSEQISGRETFTGKKLTSTGDRVEALARGVAPSLTPGIGYAAKRLEKGFAKNAEGGRGLTDPVTGQTETPGSAIAAALGFSISTNTPAKLRSFVKRDADEKIAAEKKKMRTVLRMKVPEPQNEEARQIFIREKQKIQRELKSRIE